MRPGRQERVARQARESRASHQEHTFEQIESCLELGHLALPHLCCPPLLPSMVESVVEKSFMSLVEARLHVLQWHVDKGQCVALAEYFTLQLQHGGGDSEENGVERVRAQVSLNRIKINKRLKTAFHLPRPNRPQGLRLPVLRR